ncbi:MAG TPA: ornithine carbamoyltransferase [Nitrososphaerales archaeon]|nr:ornithine carbamoyltransferase [Nitrososphaerales archaeon]HUK74533.1 ornithine carbamoyltransferase [Nitrososphaerales archaeon]
MSRSPKGGGKVRSILSVSDLSARDLAGILDRTKTLKQVMKRRDGPSDLKGLTVGLFFEKPSTRTRTSFEVATVRLGGYPLYMDAAELQTSRGEPTKDTARILGDYLDMIVGRVYAHETLEALAEFSGVPVVNALSDLEHPTQIISDLFTISETKGKLKGLNLAYVGDGDNVCNSLLLGASMVGMNVVAACPSGYAPNEGVLRRAEENARRSGSTVRVVDDPKEAAVDSDVVYTDVWVSMGEEKERSRRMLAFRGFQVNSELMKLASKDAIVMHCLPAHRGLEITDDVIEGKKSVVWRQAENKLYGAAASLGFVKG